MELAIIAAFARMAQHMGTEPGLKPDEIPASTISQVILLQTRLYVDAFWPPSPQNSTRILVATRSSHMQQTVLPSKHYVLWIWRILYCLASGVNRYCPLSASELGLRKGSTAFPYTAGPPPSTPHGGGGGGFNFNYNGLWHKNPQRGCLVILGLLHTILQLRSCS